MWVWVLSLVIVLGITLALIWVRVLVWGFHLLLDCLNWPTFYDYSCIYHLYFSLLCLFMSSSYILWIKYLPPFFLFFYINNFLSLKCLFCFRYDIYFIWDSSTILRIPDELPYCVRQYGGKCCLYPAIYYNMPCILFVSVFHSFYIYFPFLSSRGFIHIMCCGYFLFLLVILYHICSTIYSILHYTTTAHLQIP